MPVPLILTLIAAVTLPRFLPRRDEQSRPSEMSAPSSFRSFEQTTGMASFGKRSDGIMETSFGSCGLRLVCTRRKQVRQGAHLLALRAQEARSSFRNFVIAPPAGASHSSRRVRREFVRQISPAAAVARIPSSDTS